MRRRFVVSSYTTLREQRIVEAESEGQILRWNDLGELDEHSSGPIVSEPDEIDIVDITEIPPKE